MPIFYSINLSYRDVYGDPNTVNLQALAASMPTKMAIELISHFNAKLHTLEREAEIQLEIISTWVGRMSLATIETINQKIGDFTKAGTSTFSFFNNVSSLYCIEYLLANPNNLPVTPNLTAEQEEKLFKLYLYFSSQWLDEQEAFLKAQDKSKVFDWTLALMAPYSELFEFKDFRIQFIKAIYFFKFCDTDPIFNAYLALFLQSRNLASWQQYLVQLLTLYVKSIAQKSPKTLIHFQPGDMQVFQSLSKFFAAPPITPKKDFQELRTHPLYQYAANEAVILNPNFLVDKVFQSILFDLGTTLIQSGATYNNAPLTKITEFIGIFGKDFIEQHLFYRIIEYTFNRKGYQHYNGDDLKTRFGDGTPDYILIDKSKIYVIEFKNALFSADAKYSYDPHKIQQELHKKFVANQKGKPKGVTQLCNFMADVIGGRYAPLIPPSQSYTLYPLIVTTDFSFNLPTVNTTLDTVFHSQITANGFDKQLNIHPLVLIDLDSIIKFQDLFKTMRLSLNKALNEYPKYLKRGQNSIDKSVSFYRYLHDVTMKMNYQTPNMFFTEVGRLLPTE